MSEAQNVDIAKLKEEANMFNSPMEGDCGDDMWNVLFVHELEGKRLFRALLGPDVGGGRSPPNSVVPLLGEHVGKLRREAPTAHVSQHGWRANWGH